MTDAKTLAYINLHAVLGSIPYLCEIDERAKELIKKENFELSFLSTPLKSSCKPLSLVTSNGADTLVKVN